MKLANRTQYVTYDGVRSGTNPVQCGVPQGSIQGSLLFIITMNDIGNVSDLLYFILYSDVTSVLLNGKDYSDLIKLLNSELDKLSNWLSANKLYHLMLRRAIIWYFTELSLK